MLTRTEAADIPAELATQRTIASLGLAINQYVKTLQGRQMIESQELFVLNGKLYQGYNQRAVESVESLCTEDEIQNAHDVDGSKQQIMDTRMRRLQGAKLAKDRELANRRKAEISNERDALELAKLKREAAALEPEDPESEPEPIVPEIHACAACGKAFANARGLNAHKMGSKH